MVDGVDNVDSWYYDRASEPMARSKQLGTQINHVSDRQVGKSEL
jgi:hypothetical protein